MASGGSGWAQLRQQARQLEAQTESLFHTYSQYSTISNIPPKPTEEELRTEEQIKELLEKRETTLAALARNLDSEAQPSALKSSHLARHREILATHRGDFSRFRTQLATARDRANLLTSVRSDISAYRATQHNGGGGPLGGGGGEAAEAEYMLDERRRLDSSHNMADSVLSQAYAVNESFGLQREQLESVRRRITGAVGSVPGINGLIARIGNKKRRDGIILGSFIAVCFLLVWFFS